jgi:hypothetical protein
MKIPAGSSILFAAVFCVGCSASQKDHGSSTSREALLGPKPLNTVKASDDAGNNFGIHQWRFYGGTQKFVVTGYSLDGRAVRGMTIALVPHTDKAAAHYHVKMNDGTKNMKCMGLGGEGKGSFTDEQNKFMDFMRADFADFADSHPVSDGTASRSAGGIHISAVPTTGNACVDQEVANSPTLTAAGLACGTSLPSSIACTTFRSQIAPLVTACSNGAAKQAMGGGGINFNLGLGGGCDPLFDLFCGGGIWDSPSCAFGGVCGDYTDFGVSPFDGTVGWDPMFSDGFMYGPPDGFFDEPF